MSQEEQLPPRRQGGAGRRLLRVVLLLVVPLAAVLAGGYMWVTGGRIVSTENAYVKAEKVAVSTDVDGRIVEVLVADNQPVRVGDLLFRLDPESFRIQVERSEAEIGSVAAKVEALRATYSQKVEALTRAEIDIGFARREFERQRQLAQKGHASKARYDETIHALELAQQQANAIREEINEVLASLAGDPKIPVEQHPDLRQVRAMRNEAALNLRRTEVRAPINGIVTRMTLQPGEYVEAGDPIFSIVQTDDPWVEANLKETELTHIRVGQPVKVRVDAYPDVEWQAIVESISPATGAEFSLLPPQNATGNWVKVVQRIPVRVALTRPEGAPDLRAGMSVRVEIDTGREREMPGVVRSALGWMKDGN